jgi:hypothetical protein
MWVLVVLSVCMSEWGLFWLVDKNSSKLFPCAFLPDVLCSYRKDEKFDVMDRCSTCRHYGRFMREMDAEDERVMDEIDEIRRTGVWK